MQRNFILQLSITLSLCFLSSCATYYQVLETKSADVKLNKDEFAFENTDVKLNYNLWSNDGRLAFLLFNKSDAPLYIDWNKSHVIFNGISYDYWMDGEETKSVAATGNQTNVNSSSNTFVSFMADYLKTQTSISSYGRQVTLAETLKNKPKRIIQIPPHSGIYVSKFNILSNPYFNCDFNFKAVRTGNPASKEYSKSDSPMALRNYITYSTKENFEDSKSVDNEFTITTIHNLTLEDFQGKGEYKKSTNCDVHGYNNSMLYYPYPYAKPNSFYILVR